MQYFYDDRGEIRERIIIFEADEVEGLIYSEAATLFTSKSHACFEMLMYLEHRLCLLGLEKFTVRVVLSDSARPKDA